MKRKVWVGIGVLLAVAVGAAAVVSRRGPKPVPVVFAKVGREDLQAKVSANGRVQAQKKVDISATIPGQITQLAVREGDPVRKGQFLLQIDAANSRAQARSSEFSMQALLEDLDAARHALALASADAARAEENFRAGILPEAERQRAKTEEATRRAALLGAERRVDQARASLEGVRDTLSKTTIRSPMDGIVTARRIEEGEVAVIGVQNQPGTVLLTISDMSIVEAEMEIDETSIPSVALGQKARVHIDAYPNRTFDGTVTEVGNSPITATTGATEAIKFKVKVRIDNPPEGIKPGLSVQADVLTGFREKVVTVPIQSLVVREDDRREETEGVYVVEEGKVAFRPLKTGLLGELAVEVIDGVKEGETIVTGPFRELRTLKPGDAVREAPPEGDAPKG
jgi:HlyD family secretion protein